MFIQMKDLLIPGATLLFTATRLEGDTIRVTFTPKHIKKKDEDGNKELDKVPAALRTPLTIDGTAEELDADLPGALTAYVSTRQTAQASLDTIKTQVDEAVKAAEERVKEENKKGKTAGPAKAPAAAPKPTPPAPESTTAQAALF